MDRCLVHLQRICLTIIGVIGFLAFLFLTIYSWRYTIRLYYGEYYFDTKDSIVITLLVLLSVCAVFFLIDRFAERCRERTILWVAVLISIAMVVSAWVFIDAAHHYSVADQSWLHLGAVNVAEGNADLLKDYSYFRTYPYQIYLLDIFAILFRLFRTTEEIAVYHVQAVMVGFSAFAIFNITRELFQSRKAELISLLCVLVFFPMRIYSAYFYGETLGSCASLYAIWFFLRMNKNEEITSSKRILYGILTGIFLLLASLARNALIIVAVAMCIIQILKMLQCRSWISFVAFCLSLVICLGGRFMIGGLIERQTGISQENGMPAILWITMGFQDPDQERAALGGYNGYNLTTFEECGCDVEAAFYRGYQDLKDRFLEWMSKPNEMLQFIKMKILQQWNEPTYGCIAMTSFTTEPDDWVISLYDNSGAPWLINCLNQYQSVTYLLLLTGFLFLRDKQDAVHYLIGLILIGGLIFTIIWESKSRYVYPYAVLAIPFIAGSAMTWCKIIGRSFDIVVNKVKSWRLKF